jgi:hypothetical protein
MPEAAGKLLLALGEDCRRSDRWRVSVSDRDREVDCVASYEAPDLPGGCGVRCVLDSWGTRWSVQLASSTLTREQGEFWEALSDRPTNPHPFDGFTIDTAELLSFLSEQATDELLEGFRKRAAWRERRAFECARDAKQLRVLAERRGAEFACPVRFGPREYASVNGELRVRFSGAAPDKYTPARVWLLLRVRPGGREIMEGEWPRWWPTRRAADDEARRVLARLNQPSGAQTAPVRAPPPPSVRQCNPCHSLSH